MQRLSRQDGAGLIMLIGITAVLAILASSLVMLLSNQQHASAREREMKTSMDYAEAALNSAIAAVKQSDAWLTDPADPANVSDYSLLIASLDDNYATLSPAGPAVTYRLYDDVATVNAGTPAWDDNKTTKIWVQVTTTYKGHTTRLRQMVASTTTSVVAKLPKAAAFVGGPGSTDDLIMTGSADIYYVSSYTSWPATNTNGVPYTGGAPYVTSIMAKHTISAQNASDLAQGTAHANKQSVGVVFGAGGSASFPGFPSSGPGKLNSQQGNVPDLTSYLSLSDQLNLEKEARSITEETWQDKLNGAKVDARPADARPADQRPAAVTTTVFTAESQLRANTYGTYNSTTKVFTARTTPTVQNLVYNGNLTLSAGYTYNFNSLTVNGNLTVNSNISTTGLRVTGTLSVASASGTNALGPVYAIGNTTVSGAATNTFGAFWTDGSLTLSGTGATTATSVHAGANGLAINSTVGVNNLGAAYVIGDVSTGASSTSPTTFGALWTDGNLARNGSAAFTTGTLHVGKALTINSTTGANTFAATYVVGAISTSSTSTSANTFGSLWTDSNVTLSGSGVTRSTSLHVGGTLAINNTTAIINSFGPTYVLGDFSTPSTARSTNQFGALWVDGDLTLNGLTTTNSTATHVGGNFIISGPTSINTFGPVFVVGYVDWSGTASVKTIDYSNAGADPAPMWIGGSNLSNNNTGFNRAGGSYNDEYGDTFVVFRVTWASSSGTSTVNCPLFATTEMITTSGLINFGTMVTDVNHPDPRPMTLYMVCDNDGYYTQTCNWGSTGQFTGLMMLFEAGITISNGNAAAPAVVGSVLTIGGDNGLKLQNNAEIAYCQDVVDWVFFPTVSTSTVTQTVPGTWQELPAN